TFSERRSGLRNRAHVRPCGVFPATSLGQTCASRMTDVLGAPHALCESSLAASSNYCAQFFHIISPRIIFGTIDPGTSAPETDGMARYSAFVGRKVEVHYRAGDICLPASGMFVADSGRSIFLEQRFDQRGTQKTFRWEVPYAYIIRIEELPSESAGAPTPV